MCDMGSTILPLIERYFEDGVGRRELSVLAEVLHPDFIVHSRGETLCGRDTQYIPAVKAYLEKQSDIEVTIHDVLSTGNVAAIHVTKTTARPTAAWKAILLYRGVPGRHLTECWYEQDWASYRRQARGVEPVPPSGRPLDRPWRTAPAQADRSCEEIALHWVEGRLDAGEIGVAADFDVESASIDCLFSAGPRFAFHITGHRTHQPIAGDCDPLTASSPQIALAGLGTVINGDVVDVHIVSDQGAVRHQLGAEVIP